MSSAEVDLGGCGGCGLGCAVTCDAPGTDVAIRARQVLIATGIALLLLSAVPGLVVGGWALVPAAATSAAGLVVALAAVLALRRGRGAGDGHARLAYRLVPVGMAGLLVTGVLAIGLALVR